MVAVDVTDVAEDALSKKENKRDGPDFEDELAIVPQSTLTQVLSSTMVCRGFVV